jgi:phage tail protein X
MLQTIRCSHSDSVSMLLILHTGRQCPAATATMAANAGGARHQRKRM